MPALKHVETEVLTITDEKKNLHLPENKLMKEFMHCHFPGDIHCIKRRY
jgi:hypothetical protein